MTIEQLRKQFEKEYALYILIKDEHGKYNNTFISGRWEGFMKCAELNNIVITKKGEK